MSTPPPLAAPAAALSPDWLRAQILPLLSHPGRTPSDDDDLIEAGLDSLQVMRLVANLGQAGVAVTFSALIERPTLAAWEELVLAAAPAREDPGAATMKTATDDAVGGDTVDGDAFALTDVQHAYWIGRRDDQPLGGIGCHAYIELDGHDVSPDRLEAAWNILRRHHGMLRAQFGADGTQRIAPADDSVHPLPVHDLRAATPNEAAAALDATRDHLSHRRLAVETGEVAGLELSLLPDGATRIHFDVDLLVADVHSLHILLRDLAAAYAHAATPPAPVDWSFARYLAHETRRKAASRDTDRAYWLDRLADISGGPALPLRRQPEEIGTPRFRRHLRRLSPPAWDALRRHAARHRLTPALALATAYAETLARWSASPRFLLNLPLFDRQGGDPGQEEVVADFTNLLLLAVDCGEDRPFAARASALQADLHTGIAHAGYSGVRVQRDLARLRPGERSFAPVVFACNLGTPLLGDEARAVLGELSYMISQTPQVWLDHQVYELDGGLLLTWDAIDGLFPDGLIETMFAAYAGLVETLATDAAAWERPVPAALPAQQRAVRTAVNATEAPFIPRRLHDPLFTTAGLSPERVAVLDDGTAHSYGALADRALQVAALLVEQGVRPGDPVMVTVPRGSDQIVAVLGVLAAGGCYVPVGIDQPAARQARIRETADIRHALLPADLAAATRRPPLDRPVEVAPESPAYIIFTSGSTGEPKGVEVTHQAAANTVDAINRRYRIGAGDRVLAVSSLDFDLSVYDIFGLLGAGGAVVVVGEEERRDAAAWLDLIRRHRVTVWNSVPILLDMLLVAAEAMGGPLPLRLALVSGDWVGLDLPFRLATASGAATRLAALGGATEAAIWSNVYDVTGPLPPHWHSIPYGAPLDNQCYRVVDPRGQDCPDWVAGELWIGGSGLATGYRGDPAQTARRFVTAGGRRWYRTGDLGRYWPDGTLEFLGRTDHQVKVRGHRIELGEIEAALQAQPGVRHAVALAVGHPAALAAALVPDPGAPADLITRVRAGLGDRLPDYMVPATLVVRDALPLSANGKVDRAALAAALAGLATVPPAAGDDPPRGELERRVAAVWSAVLGQERVDRGDDFFLLGGDSLLATRAVARLRQEGLTADHPLRLLFARPVLAEFAAGLTEASSLPAVTPVREDDAERAAPFPLTEVQQAYLTGQKSGLPLSCGTTYALEFDGNDVDLDRLAAAWNRLVRRHEMLRAVVTEDGRQRILPEVPPVTISVEDAPGADEAAASLRLMTRWEQRATGARPGWPPFDLHAVRYGQGRCRFGLAVDYLLLDGFSVKLLLGELVALVRDPAAVLPPLRLSFRDYVLQVRPDAETVARDEAYWRGRLDDLPPAPDLPLATDPAAIAAARFCRRETRLAADRWRPLRARAREFGLTPSALLLTVYAATLAQWSGGEALTLNLTLFDRHDVHPDIHRVLGDFTTLAPVAFHPQPGASLLDLARRTRAELAEVLEYRSVSSIWVQRERGRRIGRTAALPVVFTSTLGLADDVMDDLPPGFPALAAGGISETPQVWLDHQVSELNDELRLTWDAVDGLFPAGLLDEMVAAHHRWLETLAADATSWSRPIPDLLPPGQRARRETGATSQVSPAGQALHQGFFDLARARPERTALFDGERAVSYGELSRRALRLAAALRAKGVKDAEPVAITLPRGVDQVAAVLGVLAAGSCYVPVGPDQPPARRHRILATAGIRHVVTATTLADSEDAVPLDAPLPCRGEDPAYVIFTSGSTGEPKGVEVSHQAALNTIVAVNRRYAIGADDRVLAVSSLDFDLSVYDLFGLLSAGGAMVVVTETDRREAAAWLRLIRRHGVTVWNSVPILLDMLLTAAGDDPEPLPLRVALLSGDWIGLDLPSRLTHATAGACRFAALGGATEAAIWSNLFEVDGPLPAGWGSIPYGFPLPNQAYRVVGATGQDCPDWVVGELWIGGAGVAMGYRGAPALTAERFISRDGQRWYRTGDLGRFRPGGVLEFLGRRDQQIKLRGHRIELGEIEAALQSQPGVHQAVVVLQGQPQALAAAVVLAPATAASEESESRLRAGLTESLPDYMVPSRIEAFERMPLSSNGKIDRKAVLAWFDATTRPAGHDNPRDPLESAIAAIWADTLDQPRVGRDDDFFLLGGDSLRATRIVERLCREGITREPVPLRLLFTSPTLAGFTASLTHHHAVRPAPTADPPQAMAERETAEAFEMGAI
ncbi:amino acid adenylation domain-containing protein [Phaeospirillum tilakii]|uniref:Amino acid adenylation domain-containing protein n=1 Tax=Phaeospirillum tilakii TaxID=741673 RepID=A0ABW5CG04_9PROT